MAKYIGLTIGPINKTIFSAKATRELWGASYIFSYIMKTIIRHFKDKREFIIPYTKDNSLFQQGQEVGLFHDNFILGRLYKYRAMYHLKTTEVILNEVRDLLKQISFILPGRETDKRKKIIDCSNSLVAPDITNGNYFLSFVNDLFLIQINYYYAKSNSNDLIKVRNNFV